MIAQLLTPLAPFAGVLLALLLGLLAGVQRGWAQRMAEDGTRFAGVRTFGLLGLAGGIAGHVSAGAEVLSAVVLASTAGLIVASYVRAGQSSASLSGTASIAGLIVLAAGYMAATGQQLAATAIVVVMVLLLTMRERLHALVARLSELEVAAFARFALIAAVILPLLPDRDFGPYLAWNARQLWLVVVLVCGFSLAGYVATRLLGASRGTIATAMAGSFVSSTAVTAGLAARLRSGEEPHLLNAGIAAASAVMFVRVLLLTAFLAPFALPTLALLAAPGLLLSAAAAAALLMRCGRAPVTDVVAGMPLRNPFDIGPALFLMALVMLMTLLARWVLDRYGDAELAVVLALSGAVDVDSAIITMGNLPPGTLGPHIAGLVLLPPMVLNTLLKTGVTLSVGGWRQGWPGAAALFASALACGAMVPMALG